METKLPRTILVALCAGGILTAAGSVSAADITVDEIIFQNGAGLNSGQLSPTVSMDLSGSILTIHLRNLSPDSAGDGALVLMTGVAFQLPSGVSVAGGSVAPGSTSTTGIGNAWTTAGAQNAWGYDYNSSGLSGGALAYATLTGYNTRVSTIASDGKKGFDGTGNAGGMDYGIYSAFETSVNPDPWVKDELLITLNLLGTVPTSLLTYINQQNVAVMFGSPNGAPSVPDAGGTMVLLGSALSGLGLVARRFKRSGQR